MLATIDDARLLADYAEKRSSDALGRLIERHIDFVYAAALRQVRDPAMAEDVTQAVFIILSRKAGSIRENSLAGWLFNTTRHCAANARRSELRRRRHERQAAKSEVQMKIDDSSTVSLDDALARLGRSDREVVLLRYLQEREFTEVGSILGISEQTARRRVSRAIERLRRFLGAGGQMVPSAIVLQTLSSSVIKAPANLTGATIAITGGNTAASGAAAGLAARTIHLMIWLKLKILATIILAVAITGVTSVAIVNAVDPVPTAAPPPIPATVPPVAAPDAGTVTTFPDGMRVELVGVAPSPIRKQKWWHPDGSPLAQPPIRNEFGQVMAQSSKNYTFVIKLAGSNPTWDTGINPEGSNATSSGDQGNLLCVTAAMPQNATTAAIDFVCANGPWQTRAIVSASDIFNTGITVNGVLFTSGDKGKDVSIKLSADHASMGRLFAGASRIIAIDVNGKEHSNTSTVGRGEFLTETRTITFQGLRPDQVVQFQIRSRPFNRSVKFQNISLVPGQPTAPTVEQHDSDKFLAYFAAGGSAAVVGIANWPPSGTWWSPDGSPLTDIPPDYGPYTGQNPHSGEKVYAIAVKMTDPPENPAWFSNFPAAHGVGVPLGTPNVPAGSPDVYRVVMPAGATTADFRVGLATGVWKNGPMLNQADLAVHATHGDPPVDFSVMGDSSSGAAITTFDTMTIDSAHDIQRQLLATDVSGTAHFAEVMTSKVAPNFAKFTFLFRGLPKAQIKSCQFRTRTFEYVNFHNLPLAPSAAGQVTIGPDPTIVTPAPGEQGL